MIPGLIIGVIVLMFGVIFIGGILLGVQLSQLGDDRPPTAGLRCEWRRMEARKHAAEMAGRSLNGMDGVHGRPAA